MGYTHYYYTPEVMDKKRFTDLATDVRKIFEFSEDKLGIKLANGLGDNDTRPEVTNDVIRFNGSEGQPPGLWTTNERISIPWPSNDAGLNEPNPDPIADKTDGTWFAGSILTQRVAPINNDTGKGSGSYETLCIDRDNSKAEFKQFNRNELLFNFCKTAYRPYDLVVTAVLIALKHHFQEARISSDGESSEWMDGMMLCNNILGYGMDFELNRD
tara:strand:- start:12 stop:653 length:642 start_codon:yes stop_codon:yes gene_type:complete